MLSSGMALYEAEEARQARARLREIRRVAKARGVALPDMTTEMDDPRRRDKFFAVYGNVASENAFTLASRIAQSLGIKLTALQAMNKFHCSEFIRLNKAAFYDRAPSPKQVELGERLAEIKGIKLPSRACINKDAWEEFMAKTITRDDRDRIQELVWELQVQNVDLTSYGQLVFYLGKEKEFGSNPVSLRCAKEERIKETLRNGGHPDGIQEAYPDFTEQQIYALADQVEAQGFEIAW